MINHAPRHTSNPNIPSLSSLKTFLYLRRKTKFPRSTLRFEIDDISFIIYNSQTPRNSRRVSWPCQPASSREFSARVTISICIHLLSSRHEDVCIYPALLIAREGPRGGLHRRALRSMRPRREHQRRPPRNVHGFALVAVWRIGVRCSIVHICNGERACIARAAEPWWKIVQIVGSIERPVISNSVYYGISRGSKDTWYWRFRWIAGEFYIGKLCIIKAILIYIDCMRIYNPPISYNIYLLQVCTEYTYIYMLAYLCLRATC